MKSLFGDALQGMTTWQGFYYFMDFTGAFILGAVSFSSS